MQVESPPVCFAYRELNKKISEIKMLNLWIRRQEISYEYNPDLEKDLYQALLDLINNESEFCWHLKTIIIENIAKYACKANISVTCLHLYQDVNACGLVDKYNAPGAWNMLVSNIKYIFDLY